jgi:hypothetical protein
MALVRRLLPAVLAVAALLLVPGSAVAGTTCDSCFGPDIVQSAKDVAVGTATPQETAAFNATEDWIAYQNGVTDSRLWPYPINGDTTGAGPYGGYGLEGGYVDTLEATPSAIPAAGATDVAVGGEIAEVGVDLGTAAAVTTALPIIATVGVAAIGVCTLTNLCTKVLDDMTGYANQNGASQFPGTTSVIKIFWPFCGQGSATPACPSPTGQPACTLDGNNADVGAGNGGSETYNGIPLHTGGFGNSIPSSAAVIAGCHGRGVYAMEMEPAGVGSYLAGGNFAYPLPQTTCTPTGNVGYGVGLIGLPPPGPVVSPYTWPVEHGWSHTEDSFFGTCSGGAPGPAAAPALYTGTFDPTKTNMDQVLSFEAVSALKRTLARPGCASTGASSCTNLGAQPAPSAMDKTAGSLASELAQGRFADLQLLLDSRLNLPPPSTGPGSGGPTNTPATLPGLVTVPNCVGVTLTACEGLLSNAGFGSTAVTTLTDAQADVTKPAGNVVYTTPASGTGADVSTQVQIFINPAPLPLTVPQLQPNELATAYQTRLQTLGFTNVVVTVVSDTNESTSVGPNAAISVAPAPGTQVDPATSVTVEANPSDAPPVGTAPVPGSSCGLTAPSASVNFGPITGLTLGSVFPFSIIPWLQTAVGSAPAAQRPALSLNVFGTSVDVTHPLGSTFDPVFTAIRSVLEVLLWLSAGWVLYRRILGSF